MEKDLQQPLLEGLSFTPEADYPPTPQLDSKKRKRTEDLKQRAKKTKSAKHSHNRKTKAIEDDELDTEAGVNNMFSHMDSQLLADYVATRTRMHESDLSLVELEDKYIPGMYYLLYDIAHFT
jgi:protein CMS1